VKTLFKTFSEDSSPAILIRVSEKCSSNCSFCDRPYVKVNNHYDISKILDILDFCEKNIDKKFHIGILWFDIIHHKEYDFLYEKLKHYDAHNVIIQIDFSDIGNLWDFKKYETNNINFWIQKILQADNIKSILANIYDLEDIKLNISINLIFDFTKFKFFIQELRLKYVSYIKDRNIFFRVGSCVVAFIIIEDDIEIDMRWNIKFHLNNFCNQGIKKISSIYKNSEEIKKDFNSLVEILDTKKPWKNMCKKCISLPINI